MCDQTDFSLGSVHCNFENHCPLDDTDVVFGEFVNDDLIQPNQLSGIPDHVGGVPEAPSLPELATTAVGLNYDEWSWLDGSVEG